MDALKNKTDEKKTAKKKCSRNMAMEGSQHESKEKLTRLLHDFGKGEENLVESYKNPNIT